MSHGLFLSSSVERGKTDSISYCIRVSWYPDGTLAYTEAYALVSFFFFSVHFQCWFTTYQEHIQTSYSNYKHIFPNPYALSPLMTFLVGDNLLTKHLMLVV